jgi:hypothetical protein
MGWIKGSGALAGYIYPTLYAQKDLFMKEIIDYRNSLKKSKAFDPCEMVQKYLSFVKKNNTFRSICKKENEIKAFAFWERKATHATGITNRKEEKLCHALYNTFSQKDLPLTDFGQRIVDYQTPLKNNEKDSKWGKIDLVGMIKKSRDKKLCFWEVKLEKNKDSIHYSVFELMVYLSQFDFKNVENPNVKRNLENYLRELAIVKGAGVSSNYIYKIECRLPVLFVAAEREYYKHNKFDEHRKEYESLQNEIKDRIGTILKFIEIGSKTNYCNDSKKFFYDQTNSVKVLL